MSKTIRSPGRRPWAGHRSGAAGDSPGAAPARHGESTSHGTAARHSRAARSARRLGARSWQPGRQRARIPCEAESMARFGPTAVQRACGHRGCGSAWGRPSCRGFSLQRAAAPAGSHRPHRRDPDQGDPPPASAPARIARQVCSVSCTRAGSSRGRQTNRRRCGDRRGGRPAPLQCTRYGTQMRVGEPESRIGGTEESGHRRHTQRHGGVHDAPVDRDQARRRRHHAEGRRQRARRQEVARDGHARGRKPGGPVLAAAPGGVSTANCLRDSRRRIPLSALRARRQSGTGHSLLGQVAPGASTR